eukprot:9068398-Pyramimonas_sp.AAC.1
MVSSVVWSPDGTRLISASGDEGGVLAWDASLCHQKLVIATLEPFALESPLALSPDGLLAYGLGSGDIVVR